MAGKTEKTEEQWKEELGEETFCIMRQKGTEAPFSGEYAESHEAGTYVCRACGNKLFVSDAKFESGSGWPSFFQPADSNSIKEIQDNSHGIKRTEIVCAQCESHLGHVFNDGPPPSGLRYCINSRSLKFEADVNEPQK